MENLCIISEESENKLSLYTVYLNTSVGEFLKGIHRRQEPDIAHHILFMMERLSLLQRIIMCRSPFSTLCKVVENLYTQIDYIFLFYHISVKWSICILHIRFVSTQLCYNP